MLSYIEVKNLVLRELRFTLYTSSHLFTMEHKYEDETWNLFVARSDIWLTYYFSSWDVNSLSNLLELILTDKVKESM